MDINNPPESILSRPTPAVGHRHMAVGEESPIAVVVNNTTPEPKEDE